MGTTPDRGRDLRGRHDASQVFVDLAAIPSIAGAAFTESEDDAVAVRVTVTARDDHLKTRRSLASDVLVSSLSTERPRVHAPSPPTDLSSALVTSISPSGRRHAVLREQRKEGGGESEKRRFVEVWRSDGRLIRRKEVSDVHLEFYTDNTLGGLSWHPDETALLYVAEAKPPWSSKDPSSEKEDFLRRHHYEPHFGERFVGKKRPTVFLMRWAEKEDGSEEDAFTLAEGWKRKDDDDEPVLAALVPTSCASPDETLPEGIVFGQPVFSHAPPPADDLSSTPLRLFVTGYELLADGRRLGIVYCTNRPTSVWEFEVVKTSSAHEQEQASGDGAKGVGKQEQDLARSEVRARMVSSPERSARSPRVFVGSPSAPQSPSLLVYISNARGGPHASCSQLHVVPLSSAGAAVAEDGRVIVDVVDVPSATGTDTLPPGWPGLYVDQLPDRPFLTLASPETDGAPRAHIIVASIFRSQRLPILIDFHSGRLQTLLPSLSQEDARRSFNVLGTDGRGRALVLENAPNKPGRLSVVQVKVKVDARRSGSGSVDAVWLTVWNPMLSKRIQTSLARLSYQIVALEHRPYPVELLLIVPAEAKPTPPDSSSPASAAAASPRPCILIPHGGPHSTFCTDFSANFAALSVLGYAVCVVNYAGSLGFGQRSVEALVGKCGELDVEDCLAAVDWLAKNEDHGGNLYYVSGSHGGFLGLHLATRRPEAFRAMALRNGVFDLGLNVGVTDIPDWCYAEFGLAYPFASPPSILPPPTYEHMQAASPITNLSRVTSAVLILAGATDQRVPPAQSQRVYHAMKAMGKKVDMLWFDGPGSGHALDGVEIETAAWAATWEWFRSAGGL